MKPLFALLAVTAVLFATPLHAQQPAEPADHSAHHPATSTEPAQAAAPDPQASMMSTAKLDALVEKMNSATGTARVDAMAELLTALVQDRRACEPMMAGMMKMMEMMGGSKGTMPMHPPSKE